jgi:phosphoribosyl 1,2-cyclic phosphodiesterase/CheY-like chemotaxis protein
VQVRFWGTRGSIAKPGPTTVRYGGNTSCVEVRSAAGTLVVLDCGTGLHDLGQALTATGQQPLRGHILISHTHWDHIQGIPFFAPLFVPGNEWDIYAPRGLAQSLRETLAGQMQYTYFPITLEQLDASIRYHDLVEGSVEIGEIRLRTQYLNHPALTLGYRLEVDGAVLVYACDHEPWVPGLATGAGEEIGGNDRRHAEFLSGADLVVHDAQYTAGEYPAKAGWGHSTIEYAVAVSRLAGARRLALTHHDPLRDDDAIDRLVEDVRAGLRGTGSALEVFAAAEGQVVELAVGGDPGPARREPANSVATAIPPALPQQSVLLGTTDPARARALAEALEADGIRTLLALDTGAALRLFAAVQPSLVILDQNLPGLGGLEACRAIRSAGTVHARDVPIVVTAQQEDTAAGVEAGVTDWLVGSFSTVYARTRVRAWLLRVRCGWMTPRVPEDEGQRLAALRGLGILDTEPEERFDRLTRLVAALFNVPIALVSLVDSDRQWLKSCHGLATRETPREVSFCAHAILGRDIMVVPDALQDPRFADNPLVTGEPRIRFYAGYPLILPCGSCVGTLCIVDTRPHQLDETAVQLLRDFGGLVQQELTAARPRGKRRALG